MNGAPAPDVLLRLKNGYGQEDMAVVLAGGWVLRQKARFDARVEPERL